MDVLVSVHKGTGKVAFMEAPPELVEVLRELLSLPLPHLLQILGTAGQGPNGQTPSASSLIPLTKMLSLSSTGVGGAQPPPPVLSQQARTLLGIKGAAGAPGSASPETRAALHQLPPLSPSDERVVDSFLYRRCTKSSTVYLKCPDWMKGGVIFSAGTQCVFCTSRGSSTCSTAPVKFQTDAAQLHQDVDCSLPLFRCTDASCMTFSHSRMDRCRSCNVGVMGRNASVLDANGLVLPAHLAGAGGMSPGRASTGVVAATVICYGQDVALLRGSSVLSGQPLDTVAADPSQPAWVCQWYTCHFTSNKPNMPCKSCKSKSPPGRAMLPLTLVSAAPDGTVSWHPVVSSKKADSPLHKKAEAAQPRKADSPQHMKAEAPQHRESVRSEQFKSAGPLAIITDSLQVHPHLSKIERELMREAGMNSLDDERLLQLTLGRREMESILRLGLSYTTQNVLTEALKEYLRG